jgi:hypothetical protein
MGWTGGPGWRGEGGIEGWSKGRDRGERQQWRWDARLVSPQCRAVRAEVGWRAVWPAAGVMRRGRHWSQGGHWRLQRVLLI